MYIWLNKYMSWAWKNHMQALGSKHYLHVVYLSLEYLFKCNHNFILFIIILLILTMVSYQNISLHIYIRLLTTGIFWESEFPTAGENHIPYAQNREITTFWSGTFVDYTAWNIIALMEYYCKVTTGCNNKNIQYKCNNKFLKVIQTYKINEKVTSLFQGNNLRNWHIITECTQYLTK